ncbi:MAG: hypothetical protein ACF8PN_04780 [Phycisphaerales bacterium]
MFWRLVAQFVLSLVAGVVIWAASPMVTGEVEPWDSASVYYPGALFAAGFLCGWVAPASLFFTFLGIYLGQFGYLLIALPDGPLWIVGVFVLLMYTSIAFAGALLTWLLHRLFAPSWAVTATPEP